MPKALDTTGDRRDPRYVFKISLTIRQSFSDQSIVVSWSARSLLDSKSITTLSNQSPFTM
jgi:hypothetical protein